MPNIRKHGSLPLGVHQCPKPYFTHGQTQFYLPKKSNDSTPLYQSCSKIKQSERHYEVIAVVENRLLLLEEACMRVCGSLHSRPPRRRVVDADSPKGMQSPRLKSVVRGTRGKARHAAISDHSRSRIIY